MLLRFRLHGYAVQADISAMYNQVRILGQFMIAMPSVFFGIKKEKSSTSGLELQAATTAVRMYAALCNELGLDMIPMFFWTDSTIVLGYITN